MNVLSLFDGMSCGRLALNKAGIEVTKYYSSEIKPKALELANKHFPQDAPYRLGDITKIDGTKLGNIDLLIGGSPCKNLSQAHSIREGLAGGSSRLFYEYYRLLQETKPDYFLLENVKMKKSEECIITKLLGVEPITINSAVVSPQLRQRLYWTNIPQVQDIVPKDINLNQILISGFSDRTKARCLLESDSRPLSTPIKMAHRYFNTGFTTLIFKDKAHYTKVKDHFDKYFKGKSAKDIDALSTNMDLSLYDGLRYMTKEERAICQTVPPTYVQDLTENEAAGLLGDGWTIDVIVHLLKGLNKDTLK